MDYKEIAPEDAKLSVTVGDDSDGAGILQGYASVFGNVDTGGEVVEKGAFAKTLKERLKKGMIKLFDSHLIFQGTDAVIGVVNEAEEDEYGLKFSARFSGTRRAQDVRTKVKEGILNALSFGYDVVKDALDDEKKIRFLRELKLYEVSVVPWGMNPKAQISGVKGVVPVSSFGLADEGTAWNASAAMKRFRAWVSEADPEEWAASDWAKFRRGHLWFDEDAPDLMGSYHLPVVDVIDGSPKYVFRAAAAALAACRGARGAGSGPWAADKDRIEGQLQKLYARFEKEFPEKEEAVILEAPEADVDALLKGFHSELSELQRKQLLSELALRSKRL